MKVGILTFQRAMNYGACLQAYALCRKLNELGADAHVLDYISPYHNEGEKLIKSREKIGPSLCAKIPFRALNHRRCRQFMQSNVKLTSPLTEGDLASVVHDFDSFVVGSDQVWGEIWKNNPAIFDTAYLLDFVGEGARKYSYAASMGDYLGRADEIADEHAALLAQFDEISLREEAFAELVREIAGKPVRCDIDPTLLIDGVEWMKLVSPRRKKEPYVFMYLIRQGNNVRRFAESYAESHGLELVDNKRSVDFLRYSSPTDFLSWVLNADAVFTNSFHGTAFSVLFEKQFFVERDAGNGKCNRRSSALLGQLGIKGRYVEGPSWSNDFFPIDYNAVRISLKKLRDESTVYLERLVNCAAL